MDKAFFPYGKKSKEFLLKRALYLSKYLSVKVDKIILACNTLSLIVLPFLRLYYKNVSGVFEEFLPYINSNTAILGSKQTIRILKGIYPNNNLIDGTSLISKIENKKDYKEDIAKINKRIESNSNLILACTHFLILDDNVFAILAIKNKMK